MRAIRSAAGMLLLLVAISLLLIVAPTAGQLKQNHGLNQQLAHQNPAEPGPQRYSEKVLLVSDSVTNLAQRIARAISSQKSKTEIFSPVSIAGAMSLLLLGSAGQTQKELLRVMGLEQNGLTFKDIHMAFGRLFEDLVSNEASLEPLVHWRRNDKCNRVDDDEDEDDDYPPAAGSSANDTNVDIEIGNGIFAQDGTNFDQRYNALAQKLYKSELQYLDFVGNEAKSVRAINSWVYNQTHGRIGDILRALQEKISAQTINDIVTKMKMKSVSLLLPLMHVTNSFSLKSALQQLGLYALFDRNSANLYRLLNIQRVNGDDSEDILEALQDTKDNAIKLLLEENPECQVLEKQGVDRVTCLKDNCRAGDGFCVCCAETDDFRRRRRDTTMDFLDQMNSTVYVNEMLHKIDLVVNERGTEGGAATATLIDRISSQVNFIVNGPFLMIIREETTRLPLFYGAIYSPK
uniref:Serpin domain-containing protein n=1 Tax=Anopheles albimanus TaxID=7167 RepID=A0A182F283_ANOAL